MEWKTQVRFLKAFTGTIGNSDSALAALREVTEKLINDPSAGVKALQKEILSAGRFRVVKDPAGKTIVDPKTGLPKSAVTEPAKMIAFDLMVKNMQVAFDTQEKNIEAQRIVSKAQNKIELLKAENAEIQKRIVHDQLMVQKERKHQIAKEEIVVKSRISALERESADPRQARGLTFRQELGRTQKLDKARLMEEQKLRNAQMVEENNMVLQKLASDAALIAANYRLVGADEELADAVHNLARIMVKGAFKEPGFTPTTFEEWETKRASARKEHMGKFDEAWGQGMGGGFNTQLIGAQRKAYIEMKTQGDMGSSGMRKRAEDLHGREFDASVQERRKAREKFGEGFQYKSYWDTVGTEEEAYEKSRSKKYKAHMDKWLPGNKGGSTDFPSYRSLRKCITRYSPRQKGRKYRRDPQEATRLY